MVKFKSKTIDNYNRTVHIDLSKTVRSYQILFDGLEPSEFSQRFKHKPQITLIIELRALHNDRWLIFNLGGNRDIAMRWVTSIYAGRLDEEFSRLPKNLITSFDDPNIIKKESII